MSGTRTAKVRVSGDFTGFLRKLRAGHGGVSAGGAVELPPVDSGGGDNGGDGGFDNPLVTQRNVINIGAPYGNLYAFINHYSVADNANSPTSNSFVGQAKTWMQVIDANGWPNDPAANGVAWGGGVRVPAAADYTGKYVITWTGDGTVALGGGTWTVDAPSSSNYTQNSNGNYSNTAGLVPRIVATLTGPTTPTLFGVTFTATNPLGNGAYLRNFALYRLGDEADFLAGKVFRQGFKQSLVNLNPGAIRFMDWLGGNDCKNVRFENRTLPTHAGYGFQAQWQVSPAYGDMTYTNANQYTLAAVSTGTRQTSASMKHGEIATSRIATGKGTVRVPAFGAGDIVMSAISLAANGRVTTSGAHGFSTGDTITFLITGGMPQLHRFPCVITVIDSTHFDLNINTSGFTAFTAGKCTHFITLQVGSGSDRTAYPIAYATANTLVSSLGQGYMDEHSVLTYIFDKTQSLRNDSSGNPVYGVWMFNSGGSNSTSNGPSGDVPIEICVALVNEVNEMSLAQGKNNPIHMWMNVPHMGLSSMDPDYTSASDWAVNAVDVVINPSSSVRTVGYSALGYSGASAANSASLIVEYSNETWNTGAAFTQTFYLASRGFLRWPAASSASNFVDMVALRSTVMARDIRAAFPGNSRIKITLAGQGAAGYSQYPNFGRITGSTAYDSDSLVTGGSYGTPISNHDAFAHASYFDAGDGGVYYGPGTGVGTYTDDIAMYNGTGSYTGAANPSQAITNFVNAVVANLTGGGGGIKYFCDSGNPTAGIDYTFSNAMNSLGKVSIQYEGGFDWHSQQGDVQWGPSSPISAGGSAFLVACQNSSQWATAQTNYFNARAGLTGTALPAVYVIQQSDGNGGPAQRWAYCTPDTYASHTEGQALLNNAAWVAMGSRNQALAA